MNKNRYFDDQKTKRNAGIAGVILAFVWGLSLIYWNGFVDRTDLYGSWRTANSIFGWIMMAATSGGMLFVFDMIGKLEKRIKLLEQICFGEKPDAIDHMCDDFGSPRI